MTAQIRATAPTAPHAPAASGRRASKCKISTTTHSLLDRAATYSRRHVQPLRVTKGQSAIRDLFAVKRDRAGNHAATARDLPRPDGADRPRRRRRRARACHGALGNARAAAVRRPAGDEHPEREEPALAAVARQGKPLHRAGDVVLRICRTRSRARRRSGSPWRGRPLFAFAGLWTPWRGVRGPKSAPVDGDHELFGFLTTDANAIVAPIHPKAMPVILTPCRG